MSSLPANYIPVRHLITNVTQAKNAVVTTANLHGFSTGQWVRLIVPLSYGMEISYVPSQIDVLSTTEFQTNIDTRTLRGFVSPIAPPAFTPAQVIPISGTTDNVGIS